MSFENMSLRQRKDHLNVTMTQSKFIELKHCKKLIKTRTV
jgi:hypothetical protein